MISKKIIFILMYLLCAMFLIAYINRLNRRNVKIEYRYIPRSFEEEQELPDSITYVTSKLFGDESELTSDEKVGGSVYLEKKEIDYDTFWKT